MSGTAKKAAGNALASTARWRPNANHNMYWRSQRQKQAGQKLYRRELARAAGATDEYGQPLKTKQTWHVVKGDLVEVTRTAAKRNRESGRGERLRTTDGGAVAEDWLGQRGRVIKVMRKTNQVIVRGVNLRTRVVQPTVRKTGHFTKVESPISYAHVSLVDPNTDKPVSKIVTGGRVRVTDSGAVIKKPWLAARKLKRDASAPELGGPKMNPQVDTTPEVARQITYRKPVILRPAVRADTDPTTGQPLLDELGRIVLIPEGMELKTARMKF